MLAALAVLGTLHLTGAVPVEGGDYLIVPFTVPAGTAEMTIAHDDGSATQILDWGVWSPDGFRGWGGGLTDDAIVGVAGSSRGYLPGPITPGAWQVVIGKAKLGGLPGAYTIDVEFRDAGGPLITPEPARPWTPVTLSPERRWYAGDFHVHSRDSGDATATLQEIVALARARGLDFVVLSDHNTTAQLEHQAAVQEGVTDVLLVRGAEITTYAGHGNAIGTGAYVDHRVGLGGVSSRTIVEGVHAQGGAFIVNHPVLSLGDLCIGCAWAHTDTPWPMVGGVEIHTGNADVTLSTFTPRAIEFWDARLAEGARLAAIGGSDDHRAGMDTGATAARIGSPTTMVLADSLSEAAILDAVEKERTFVLIRGPEAPGVELSAADAYGGSGRAGYGEVLEGVGGVMITADAPEGDGVVAELWRDGERVDTAVIAGGRATFTRPVSGERERYRIELTRDGERVTVTSHVYVHGDPRLVPEEGCGCASGGRGAMPGAAIVLAGLLARRRRGSSRAPRGRDR